MTFKEWFSAYKWISEKSNRIWEWDPEHSPKRQIDVFFQECNNSFHVSWVGWDTVVSSFLLSWLLNFLMIPLRARPNLIFSGGGGQVARWIKKWAEERVWQAHVHCTHFIAWYKGFIFFLSSRTQTPKSALLLEPKPKARPPGSTGGEKDIFKKLAIGKSHSLVNYLSHENVDTIFEV